MMYYATIISHMAKNSARFNTVYCISQYSVLYCINTKYMDDVQYIYRRHDVPYSIITFYKLNNIVYFKAFPNTSKFVLYDIE